MLGLKGTVLVQAAQDQVRDFLAPKVAAGAALLDEEKPGWQELIDWELLDILNPQACIAGQVFAKEAKTPQSVTGWTYGSGWAYAEGQVLIGGGSEDYGMDIPDITDTPWEHVTWPPAPMVKSILEELWLEEAMARKPYVPIASAPEKILEKLEVEEVKV